MSQGYESEPGAEAAAPSAGAALRSAVTEVEVHVAQAGWDGPARLFALVDAAAVAGAFTAAPQAEAEVTPPADALVAVEQDQVPAIEDDTALIEFLGSITWPDQVVGCVLSLERSLSSSAGDGRDVRIVAGVLRPDEPGAALPGWGVARLREYDSPDAVLSGEHLVEGLVEILAVTFDADDADADNADAADAAGDGP